jgi:hypothetical protein
LRAAQDELARRRPRSKRAREPDPRLPRHDRHARHELKGRPLPRPRRGLAGRPGLVEGERGDVDDVRREQAEPAADDDAADYGERAEIAAAAGASEDRPAY